MEASAASISPHHHEEDDKQVVDEVVEDRDNLEENLFDNLDAELSEALGAAMESALRKGVTTLPTFAEGGPLLGRLLCAYLKSADYFELYANRNVFTLEQIVPKNLRREVALLYRYTPRVETLLFDEEDENDENNDDEQNHETVDHLTDEDFIPTFANVDELHEEIQQLHLRKRALFQAQHALQDTLTHLSAASRVGQEVTSSLGILEPTAPVIQCAQALQDTMEAAKECKARMESLKRDREENDDDDDDIVMVQKTKLPQNHNDENQCNSKAGFGVAGNCAEAESVLRSLLKPL